MRRWQEGTVYLRSSRKLPDAWWGRFVETVRDRSRGLFASSAGRFVSARRALVKGKQKPLAKRALREHVDVANNYQPQAVKVQQMGKGATPFSVFAARLQQEVLNFDKKASTASAVKEPHQNIAFAYVRKVGDG